MSLRINELFNSQMLGAVLANGHVSDESPQALLLGPLESVFGYDSEKKTRTNEIVAYKGEFVFINNRFLRQSVKFDSMPPILAPVSDSDYPIVCTLTGLEAGVLNSGYIYAKAKAIKEVESYDK